MGWETRSGKQYFYLNQRIGGRVWKRYFGSGPIAEAAAKIVEDNKRIRKENREKRNGEKLQLMNIDRQLELLAQAPLIDANPKPPSDQPTSRPQLEPLPTTPVVLAHAQKLLDRRKSGDHSVDAELTQMLERYPSLLFRFADLGLLAHANLLKMIAGDDSVFQAAIVKQLDALRAQFPVNGDPASRLLVDRILATWLHIAYADSKLAQSEHLDRSSQVFYAGRQQQAHRQHMEAIRAWRQWQQMPREAASHSKPGPKTSKPECSVDHDRQNLERPFSKREARAT